MKRSIGLVVLAGSWMMAAACGRHPSESEASASPTAGMIMTTQVRAAPNRCGAAPKAATLRDAIGVAWWREKAAWCRAASRNEPPQTWTAAIGGRGSHEIVSDGARVALVDSQVQLTDLTGPPVATAPFIPCPDDRRGRAFAAQNWLVRPDDLRCAHLRTDEAKVITAGFAGPYGTMPALLASPAGPSAGTILYLMGGPYQNLFKGLGSRATVNHLLARWAGRATIAIPSYLGVDRMRIGDGDVVRARAETSAMLDALQGRGPVCVIGFSMGSAVAAPLAARHPSVSFLLAAPLATSPAAYVKRARTQGRAAVPFELYSAVADGRRTTLPSDEALLSYFAGEQEMDLAGRLGGAPRPNVRIAYAADDIPVTREDLSAVARKVSAGAISELPAAVGHSIETPFAASAYHPLIDRFLAQCLKRQPAG